jgi:HEAT repeat protein
LSTDPPDERRRRIAAAGHTGSDEALAAAADPDPTIRRLGLSALARQGRLGHDRLTAALHDEDATVRRRAAELAASRPTADLGDALVDGDPRVVEMAAWAVGERPYDTRHHDLVVTVAREHDDPLCREAAVAALGAVGRDEALAVILDALDDVATVRRRAVVALAPYETPEVTAALRLALDDRDWQVRQAAEDLSPPPTRDPSDRS